MPRVPAYGVAFSPDGRQLAVTFAARHSEQKPTEGIAVWDLETLESHFVPTENFSAYQISFHPTEDALAAVCFHSGARLQRRDLRTNEKLDIVDGREDIWQLALSPDGRWFAGAGNHPTIHIWDWKTGAIFNEGGNEDPGTVSSLAFHPSSEKMVAIGWGKKAWCWTYPDRWEKLESVNQWSERTGVFTPDGRSLLTAGDSNGIRLWNTDDWSLRCEYEWDVSRVDRIAVSPDGSRAAVGAAFGQLVVWDLD